MKGRTSEFLEFEERILNHDLYIASLELNDTETLITLKVPDKFHDDYLLFYKGKYSQLKPSSKKIILTFWRDVHENTEFYKTTKMVLEKSPILRRKLEKDLDVKIDLNQDLSSIINIEDETYDIKRLPN